MTPDEFTAQVATLRDEALARLAAADSPAAVLEVRHAYLGDRRGALAALSAALKALPSADRAAAGQAWQQAIRAVDAALDAAARPLTAASVATPRPDDPTMPGRHPWRGAVHPVAAVIDEIVAIFRELGFTVQLGPEAESPWYNFGGLNFPADHPAMDMHDTLYLRDAGGGLLRTHTSPVQLRTLQAFPPPVRVLAPGMVYRRDFFDATHAPAFAQIEGLCVDDGVSFVDLKATLTAFARRFYGGTRRTRFGPSYFPFTEPSAQMDVEVDLGDGRGPRWIEILGCGMVHPAVLESAGVDSDRFTGWAFGMGPARIAMSRHGLPDIRLLYDGDVRFHRQFAG
jgi:phenylalanyl-tRNA synthetase alpha chain